ncbi:MAG TPA: alpha/beta hydrolase [Pirellulales bacterium]|jgi:acetyl esterase/lipase|nr:alpha/beta hydrolase [Pirellulales bacterium]
MKNQHRTFIRPLLLSLFLPLALLLAAAGAQEKRPGQTPEAEKKAQQTGNKTASLEEQIKQRFGDKVELRFDQPYAGTSNKFQMLDLYLPKHRADDKPLPLVVFIHGGGWSGGDRKGYAVPACILAASGKYAAASVGYRLSAEAHWPQQIFDCKAAIRWLRGHAKELGLDPDKIGVTGASAGGHLVTLLGLTGGVKDLEGDIGEYTSQSSRVTCVVNVCGPMDLTKPLMQGEAAKRDDPAVSGLLGGPVSQRLELAKEASPLTYVTAQAVPIMTLHGTQDMRVNFTNAQEIDAALKKVGATSLLIPVEGAGHGIPFGPELQKRVQAFWDMYLRGVKSEISTSPIEASPAQSKK